MDKVQFLVDDYSSKDCSLHQKYVNTCNLNGDGDSFGVTDHKAEERLVSTAERLVQVLSKIVKMSLC